MVPKGPNCVFIGASCLLIWMETDPVMEACSARARIRNTVILNTLRVFEIKVLRRTFGTRDRK
jgi:hypothetical protein